MFTRNFYKLHFGRIVNNDLVELIDFAGVKRADNNPRYGTELETLLATQLSAFAIQNGSGGSSKASGFAFGDGNVSPTVDDYSLSGEFLSGLSVSSSVSIESTTSGKVITTSFGIQNPGADPITIREIALCDYAHWYNGFHYYAPCVIDRTVLETPVTIPAGGVGQVTYTIRLPYPA